MENNPIKDFEEMLEKQFKERIRIASDINKSVSTASKGSYQTSQYILIESICSDLDKMFKEHENNEFLKAELLEIKTKVLTLKELINNK